MTKYVVSGKAGDIVCCLNGHELYRLLEDVKPGGLIESRIFEPIGDAPKPEYGKTVKNCHICDTPWLTKGIGGGFVMCNLKLKFDT